MGSETTPAGGTPPATETPPAGGTPPAAPPAGGAPVQPEAKPKDPSSDDSLLGGETTPEGQKPGSETTVSEIEIKVPEGVELDAALMEKFKPLAKELGLDSAKAQKMVDLYVDGLNGLSARADAAWNETKNGWLNEAKADKEFGGAKLTENLAIAKKAIDKFGTPGLRELLNQTGVGNHPELIRAFVRIGKAISEDSIAGSTAGAPPARSEDDKLAEAYPSMYKK